MRVLKRKTNYISRHVLIQIIYASFRSGRIENLLNQPILVFFNKVLKDVKQT